MIYLRFLSLVQTAGGDLGTTLQSEEANERLRAFLQQVFACSSEIAGGIARRAAERTYPARAVILRQGEPDEQTFLVMDGCAQALLCGPQGQVVLLHEYRSGDIFGPVAPGEHASEAEVAAAEATRAAAFRAADFLQIVEMHACVARAVARLLTRQLRAARERIAAEALLSATGRVHAELLRLARGADGGAIRPAPVLAALAVQVHSTRETVSRAISALERRGIVRREADALVVVAPKRLAELVV